MKATWYAEDIWTVIIVVRFIHGIGHHPASIGYIADWFPSNHAGTHLLYWCGISAIVAPHPMFRGIIIILASGRVCVTSTKNRQGSFLYWCRCQEKDLYFIVLNFLMRILGNHPWWRSPSFPQPMDRIEPPTHNHRPHTLPSIFVRHCATRVYAKRGMW